MACALAGVFGCDGAGFAFEVVAEDLRFHGVIAAEAGGGFKGSHRGCDHAEFAMRQPVIAGLGRFGRRRGKERA